ncbi:MAG: acyl-CoA desaturase [Aeromicrobium sp.]|uniref:fatty acid desaturase family protein n=1 Tax=Aeromicrobium sp. TaxID=1871063 RepID=UPI0039E2804F
MTVTAERPSVGHDPDHPLHKLTPEQLEEIGKEFQAIHDEVYADLGERDAEYIRGLVRFHRRLAALSRVALLGSKSTPALVGGTIGLSIAKIIENMELGHNILHGQWDWMNDPHIHSSTWEWDSASPSSSWKHSHNYMHHTYTNVIGKDHDVGYEIMRVDERQPWKPAYLAQPLYNLILAGLFEWGVAFHDLDMEAVKKGEKPAAQLKAELKEIGRKARRQIVKDYVAFPLLSGRAWKRTLLANVTANVARNVWAYAIIFCGHFPDQAYTFTEEEAADESLGAWYVRQLIGSADIEGGDLFHLMSGNLSFQVEHHLFPDMPSSRYKEIAPRVKEICAKYELPYNTGPFLKQFGMVQRTILRLAFPGGGPTPKPGPFKAGPDDVRPPVDENPLREPFPAAR